eukprot:3937170-Rhodomonas_salina.1
MYPGKDVLKVLISVHKGKPFAKGAKAQIAFLPMSKCCPDPDISIRHAISLAKPNAKLCVDLTRDSCCPKYMIPQPSQRVTLARSSSGSSRILTRGVTTNAALLASATRMLSSQQSEHAYTSAFTRPIRKTNARPELRPTLKNGSKLRK